MELDPELDPEMEEILRLWDGLRYAGYVLGKKTIRLYDDLDDFAASVAISELSSID